MAISHSIIQKISRGKYKAIALIKFVTGVIYSNNNVKTHLILGDGGDNIFIAERKLNHVMKNDRVKVLVYAKRNSRQTEELGNNWANWAM